MFSADDIKNDVNFKEFIKDKNLAPSSKNIYAYRLKDFSDFIAKSPSEILESYESEYFKKIIFDYIKSMRDGGKSEITIQNNLDTIRTFYNGYNIKIPSNKDFNPEIEFEEEVLSKYHVKKALEVINKRDEAIILLQFTSGISPKILRNLTYGDFINAMDDYLNIPENKVLNIKNIVNILSKKHELIGKWVIRKKTGEIFYTFNTTESSLAIMDYLMQRQISSKPVKNLKDPLFVNQANLKLKKSTYNGIFTRINKKADFKLLNYNKRFFTSINLKKSFKESLLKGGLDKNMVNIISGRKSPVKWDKEDVENFKINYKRSSRFLIIEENNDLESLKTRINKNDVELNELKSQIKYLKHLMAQNK